MAATEPDFDAVFDRLKAILEPYAPEMYVSADDATMYGVDMAPEAERNPTTWFGAVRRGKRYVSIYLMPVYVDPGLLDDASPELRKRMQGKSCFNFNKVDEPLIGELEALVRTGYERTAGDPSWGAAQRVERGMAHRKAGASVRGLRRPISAGGAASDQTPSVDDLRTGRVARVLRQRLPDAPAGPRPRGRVQPGRDLAPRTRSDRADVALAPPQHLPCPRCGGRRRRAVARRIARPPARRRVTHPLPRAPSSASCERGLVRPARGLLLGVRRARLHRPARLARAVAHAAGDRAQDRAHVDRGDASSPRFEGPPCARDRARTVRLGSGRGRAAARVAGGLGPLAAGSRSIARPFVACIRSRTQR